MDSNSDSTDACANHAPCPSRPGQLPQSRKTDRNPANTQAPCIPGSGSGHVCGVAGEYRPEAGNWFVGMPPTWHPRPSAAASGQKQTPERPTRRAT